MKYIIFFICISVFLSCSNKTTNNIVYTQANDILKFKNYYEAEIALPENWSFTGKVYDFTDDLFTDSNFPFDKETSEKISDSLFTILHKEDIINSWNPDWYDFDEEILKIDENFIEKEEEKYLEHSRFNTELYYLGSIKINDNFSSSIVFKDSSTPTVETAIMIDRNIYLLNSHNGALTSITNVSSLNCAFEDCVYSNVKLEKDKSFIYKQESISTDVIMPQEMLDSIVDEVFFAHFKYDDNGYVQLIEGN